MLEGLNDHLARPTRIPCSIPEAKRRWTSNMKIVEAWKAFGIVRYEFWSFTSVSRLQNMNSEAQEARMLKFFKNNLGSLFIKNLMLDS